MFFDIFRQLCEEKGKSMTACAIDMGISKSLITSWRIKGFAPNQKTLIKISDYFNVPIDYLLEKEKTAPKNKIPVLGSVRAGYPMYAEENIIDYEEISNEMALSGEYFALKVKGDSMIPRFVDGDIVIVKKCETVENGEIAIVMVGQDEATIKKFYKTAVGVQLVATNPNYPAMTFTPEQVDSLPVTISGKVVELRAKF